tara:strand:- start:193 stop:351 length:159 start_codon:yes stop_codon:yes gene_type:complete
MLMYLSGTDPIDVHPTKVSEMERKGWSTTPVKVNLKKSSPKKDDLKNVAEKE